MILMVVSHILDQEVGVFLIIAINQQHPNRHLTQAIEYKTATAVVYLVSSVAAGRVIFLREA
jgi:hypothetical protein